MVKHKKLHWKLRHYRNKKISNNPAFFKRVAGIFMAVVILLGQIGIRGIIEESQNTALAAENQTSIPLKKLSGSGEAFVYCHFNEVMEFCDETTYALLDDIYDYEEAVCSLGSGAVLKVTSSENNSKKYIRSWYGSTAEVKTYVDVITKGKEFDSCVIGGLYQVPDSGTPTEYRYFCGYGGAQNCGPLYAYSYEKGMLSYENISASLNDIESQGSTKSSDYTVTITYENNIITLDSQSYTVQIVKPDTVIITVEDSEGNQITTNFTGPLVVRYNGNADGVTNVPDIFGTWKGEALTISSMVPLRSGYAFQGWKDSDTGTFYAAGQKISAMSQSLNLMAQWKDIQKPDVTYQGVQVITHTSDEEVKALVEKALVITDNEPVSECTVAISAASGIADTMGQKTVSVTVTDKAGNQTTKSCIVDVVARPVEINKPVFTESTKVLSATLREPGSDEITETGFVWGVMNNPTITLYNGKVSTSSPVITAYDAITVTADDLQKGVAYYGRAYVIAGGITYYSEEISFGLGLPAYGVFTIKNNGNNTFTVTRSSGSEETQTVYYRTVNGSAVGGTHFTHVAGTLTFNSGETSKTITVTEKTANTAYGSNAATVYSNADRTYQMELYRVTGGASLGDTITATRTMTAGSSYKVDRTIYTQEKSKIQDVTNKWVTDHSGGNQGDVIWRSDRSQNTNENKDNFNSSREIDSASYPNIVNYIKGTAGYYLYRYEMKAHEDEDGWEHAWMGTARPGNAGTETKCSGSYAGSAISLTDSVAGNAIWTAVFQVGEGSSTTKIYPTISTNSNEDTGSLGNTVYAYKASENIVTVGGTCYAKIPVSQSVYNYFSACGSNQDRWYVEGFTDYTRIYDVAEPQLLSVAPMAGGVYKAGDTFTVALIFDEIVDSKNSSLTDVSLRTNWGQVSYAGGADTNVLYFTGTVGALATGNLEVWGINNPEYIKDMSDESETACSGGSGATTASVDTAVPYFTVTSGGIKTGTGTAKVTVNADKTKTTSMKYAWSDTASMPVSGWVELSAQELSEAKETEGLSLSIRKTAGSGSSNGKWYLHVIGTYGTTGATSYKSTVLDFGTASAPAAGSTPLSMTVSADNTNWANSRTITVNTTGGGTLKYRYMGDTDWTVLTSDSLTVTSNGYYTFILTEDDQTVTQNILIEKLDNTPPAVTIGSPKESGTTQTKKQGVYTVLTLPVNPSDGESYVAGLEYVWTNSSDTPSSGWITADTGTTSLTYTSSESTETTKYLHLRVTDGAGNKCTEKSQAYTMISQTVVDNHTPDITITGAPAEWTNDMPTLMWELTNYEGKDYTVTMTKDTDVSYVKSWKDSKGEFLATQNAVYTVTVTDNEYGGTKSATLTVDKLDIAPPSVTVTGVSDKWEGSSPSVTIDISDSQSGIREGFYKLVSSDSEIPDNGLTAFTGSSNTLNVTDTGIWYIYYKITDNTADTALGRPANITEGFAGPVKLDEVTPVLTIDVADTGAETLELTLEAVYGISGGKVTVGDSEISQLTALESIGAAGETKSAAYKVTSKGTYTFKIESGAGKTASQDIAVYEAVLKAQNGTGDKRQLVAENGKLTKPVAPSKEGYTFGGWYTEEEGGSKWDFENSVVSEDITLYAQYTADIYAVTYEKNGGIIEDEDMYTTYTYGIGLPLPNPEKEGAYFSGWYTTSDFGGTKVTEISATDMGAKTYYARWTTKVYTVSLIDGTGYTLETDSSTDSVNHGDNFTFRLKVADGYSMTKDFAVKVNGEKAELKNGQYTIDSVDKDITVTVEGVADITAPDVWISIGEKNWNTFWNDLPFSVFFNKTQDVTITAQDAGSGLNGIYYYIGSGELPLDEVWAVTEWKEYTGNFSVEAESRYVIYVKASDNVGNTVYVNSDGITLDRTIPVITGIENGKTYYGKTVFEVTESALDSVTIDGTKITADEITGKYTIPADNREHIIIAADKSGNRIEYRVTVYDIYTVTYVVDGNIVDIQHVIYGMDAVAPDIPEKTGYDMTAPAWDKDSSNITEDTTINAVYTINRYNVTIPEAQNGYMLIADLIEAEWNGSVNLFFIMADGYSMTDDFAVKVNGETITLTDGQYIVNNIQENIIVTVEGVVDITAPDGEITISTHKWNSFLNTINFVLLFKEMQTVAITAKDYGSGTASIEYYVSYKALTKEEVEALTSWISYTKPFKIEQNNSYVIYARLTDNAGNVTYISSDGMVIERIASGNLQTEINIAKDVPAISIEGLTEKVVKEILHGAELTAMEAGEDVLIHLEVTNINNTISEEHKLLVESCLKKQSAAILKSLSGAYSSGQLKTGIMYLDLSLYKKVGNNSDTKIYSTNGNMLTINVQIPEELKSETEERAYVVIRVHEDESGKVFAEPLATVKNEDGTLTFETDRFSTYGICYIENKLSADNNGNNKTDNSPGTNDSKRPWAWMWLLLAAPLAVFSAAMGYRRKKM